MPPMGRLFWRAGADVITQTKKCCQSVQGFSGFDHPKFYYFHTIGWFISKAYQLIKNQFC